FRARLRKYSSPRVSGKRQFWRAATSARGEFPPTAFQVTESMRFLSRVSRAEAGAAGQGGGERPVVRPPRGRGLIRAARVGPALAVERAQPAHSLEVAVAHRGRVDLQLLARFQVAEQRRSLEGELQLGGVLDVQDEDVVPVAADQPDRLERLLGL